MTPDEATQALLNATADGDLSAAQAALAAGADPNDRNEKQRTPLHLAADQGATALASLLIEKGAATNAKDDREDTPLHRAAGGGYDDIAQLLIDRGAELTARNKWQRTPEDRAREQGHVGLVTLLQDAVRDHGHADRVSRKRQATGEPQIGGRPNTHQGGDNEPGRCK